jgi:serine protease
VIIKYRDDVVVTSSARTKIERYGTEESVRVADGFRVSRLAVDDSQGKSLSDVIAYLESLPEVEFAERDQRVYALGTVNDTYFPYQWNFSQLHLATVWDEVTGDESVVVAVVDTGVAYDLSDLAATSFVQGKDYVNSDSDAYDDNSHGTHVAGTIAQSTDNAIGAAGVAPDVSIMPVKVLGQDGSGALSNVASGITWAVDNGADVINLSLGSSSATQTAESAVKYAYDNGVPVIAASGNDNGPVGYPAAYDSYVLAVGATRYDKARAPYSNYGPELDVVAPGGDTSVDQNGDGYDDGILQQTIAGYNSSTGMTDYSSGYYFYQGTSMATPHVAALAALVLTKNGELAPDEVYSTITGSADDLGTSGRDDYFGYGLVNPIATLSDSPWLVSDSRNEHINETENTVDSWEIAVAGGPVTAEAVFAHLAADIDLHLYDPSGHEVASSTTNTDNEAITYQSESVTGIYTVEVKVRQ